MSRAGLALLPLLPLLACRPAAAPPATPAPAPPAPCPDRGGAMVLVPAGPFAMGAPPRPATLAAFCIDRTEVTAAAFAACAAGGACEGFAGWPSCGSVSSASPNVCRPGREAHPANFVDRERARAFCRWAGKRLPSEAEWEKSARGPDGRTYPWGEALDCARGHFARGGAYDACRGAGGLPDDLAPAGAYADAPSPYGAIQLAGNVKEWVEADGRARTKGGSFRDGDAWITAAAHDDRIGADRSSDAHGFRCAATPIGR